MVVLNEDSRLVLRTDIALEVIVTLAVICRFGCRLVKRAAFAWDDGWMVFAWAAYTAFAALCITSVKAGAVQTTENTNLLVKIGKLEYVAQLMFETAHVGAKASLACLCWRIQPVDEIKKLKHAILCLCITWYISCLLVTLFHCSPIDATWDWSGQRSRCIDTVMFCLGYEMGNIVCNLAIMYLVVRVTTTAKLPWSKKVTNGLLFLIFILGSWVIVTSAIRIECLFHQSDSRDSLVYSRIWASVAAASSIICANLPANEPVFGKILLNKCFGGRSNRESWKSSNYSVPGASNSLRSRRWRKNPFTVIGIDTIVSHPTPESGREDNRSEISTHPLNSIRVNHTIEMHESYKGELS